MKTKIPILASAILVLLLACCKEQRTKAILQTTLEKTIRTNFESLIEDAWNKRDMKKLKAISAKNYIKTLNGITVATHQNEMEANLNIFFKGFPDCEMTVEQLILKDNNLFVHWTFKGTNNGVFGESAPTGKKVNVAGCSAFLFNNQGKITQEDVFYNELALLQQLGFTLKPPITE